MNSPWYGASVERISTYLLARRGEEILEHIARNVDRVPPQSRLQRAVWHLDSFNRALRAGTPPNAMGERTLTVVREASRLLWDALIVFFVDKQAGTARSLLSSEHFDAFVSGTDLPVTNKDRVRDFQFEAYVGASLAISGVPVRRGEPDFIIESPIGELGIAVKRVSSTRPQKLYDRLRDGAHQLQGSTRRGYVAVNLDSWITQPPVGDTDASIGAQFQEEIGSAYKQLRSVARYQHLLGMMVFARWGVTSSSGEINVLATSSAQQIIHFADHAFADDVLPSFFSNALGRFAANIALVGQLVLPAAGGQTA